MYTTCSDVPDTKPLHLDPEPIALKSTAEILCDINIDGNISQKEKGPGFPLKHYIFYIYKKCVCLPPSVSQAFKSD